MTFGDELGDPTADRVERELSRHRATVWMRAWRDPEVELEAERDALEEERVALDDQISRLRTHGCECLARALDEWERNRARREGLPAASHPDGRGLKNAGVDEREGWGEP